MPAIWQSPSLAASAKGVNFVNKTRFGCFSVMCTREQKRKWVVIWSLLRDVFFLRDASPIYLQKNVSLPTSPFFFIFRRIVKLQSVDHSYWLALLNFSGEPIGMIIGTGSKRRLRAFRRDIFRIAVRRAGKTHFFFFFFFCSLQCFFRFSSSLDS